MALLPRARQGSSAGVGNPSKRANRTSRHVPSPGRTVGDLGQRNPTSGFSDAQRHPGVLSCPRTGWCGQQELPLSCLGGCGNTGAGRQDSGRDAGRDALGAVPRKLHLCRLLSDQHPTGATAPAWPCCRAWQHRGAWEPPRNQPWCPPASPFHWSTAMAPLGCTPLHPELQPQLSPTSAQRPPRKRSSTFR